MIDKIKMIINKNSLFFEIVLAFLLTTGLIFLFGKTLSKEYLLALIIFIAMLALVRKSKHFFSTRRMKFSLWFAIPFAVALWFGQKVVCQSIELREFTFLDLPLILCLIVVFSLMTICVFGFIDSKSFIIKNKRMVNKKRWLIMAGIIFACYLPLFLSFFPGIVSVDSVVQIRQAIGETEQWSNWHPVLHTAFMALPINIGFNMFGDLTAGIAMATLVQMIILSLIFGYVCDWAIRKTGKIWVGYAFMVFFALCGQCLAEIVVIARESSWKWAGIAWAQMTFLAWLGAVLCCQIGSLF